MSLPIWITAKAELTDCQAVYWLWKAYLYAAAWGTRSWTELEDVDSQACKDFADMVSAGDLFSTIENLKRLCLVHGVELSNRILADSTFASLRGPDALPEEKRQRLLAMHDDLYPTLCRLEVK